MNSLLAHREKLGGFLFVSSLSGFFLFSFLLLGLRGHYSLKLTLIWIVFPDRLSNKGAVNILSLASNQWCPEVLTTIERTSPMTLLSKDPSGGHSISKVGHFNL